MTTKTSEVAKTLSKDLSVTYAHLSKAVTEAEKAADRVSQLAPRQAKFFKQQAALMSLLGPVSAGLSILGKAGTVLKPLIPELTTLDKLAKLYDGVASRAQREMTKDQYVAALNAYRSDQSDQNLRAIQTLEQTLKQQDRAYEALIAINRDDIERGRARFPADNLANIKGYEFLRDIVPRDQNGKYGIRLFENAAPGALPPVARQTAEFQGSRSHISLLQLPIQQQTEDIWSLETAYDDLAVAVIKANDAALSGLAEITDAQQERIQKELDAAVAAGKAGEEIQAIWNEASQNLKTAVGDSLAGLLDGSLKGLGDVVNKIGGVGSNLVKNLVGKQATNALGGLLGSFSSFAGPLGGAIGSAAGALASKAVSALGKVLGGKPSDKTEGVTLDLINGTRREGDLGPKKDSPENRAASNELETRFLDFEKLLESWNLSPNAWGATIEVGSAKDRSPFRASLNNSGVRGFQTADEAFAFLANSLVDTLSNVPARLQSIVDNFDGRNVEAFVAELQKIADFDKGIEGVRDEIQKLTDPKQWELDELQDEFKDLRSQAAAFGDDPIASAAIADIERLISLRSDEINKRYEPPAPPDDGFDGMLDGIRDEFAQAADPKKFELDELKDRYDEMTRLARQHGEGLEEVEAWYGRQRTAIADKYADEAAAVQRESASKAQAVLDQIAQQARENVTQQLNVLAQQRQTIEESMGQYRGVIDSIKSAKARFASDTRLSPTSNEQRLSDLMAQLNAAYAKAQAGDMEAAAQVADLAMAAAEANVAFNASSGEGARVQAEIATILDRTGSVANRQLQVAELSLQANETQVALLQAQLDAIGKTVAQAPRASTQSDFNDLYGAFAAAKSNALGNKMTDVDFVNSAVYTGIKESLFDLIGRSTDVDFLKENLGFAESQAHENNAYAAGSAERAAIVRDRLHELGVQGFARGGRTGAVAFVHPNEMIYTGPPAMVYNARETASMMSGGNVLRELQGIRADIGVLSRTVSISGEDQVVQLARQDMRLAAIESNFSLARARA